MKKNLMRRFNITLSMIVMSLPKAKLWRRPTKIWTRFALRLIMLASKRLSAYPSCIFLQVSDYMLKKQKETGIKLLWGTANLFSNPRFVCVPSASSPQYRIVALWVVFVCSHDNMVVGVFCSHGTHISVLMVAGT